MNSEFDSIHNYYEQAVFRRVASWAGDYPQLGDDVEVLAELLCVLRVVL